MLGGQLVRQAPRRPQVGAPVIGRLGQAVGELAPRRVKHEFMQVALAPHMPVQGRGADAEAAGDPAYGRGLQAALVGQLHRGPDDLISR
jgi:hypothetical protein